MPAKGEMAPDFELLDQDGNKVKLSDFRGKKVILFAYPRADTPGCTTQACGFRDVFPRIQKVNAVVMGISPDQPEDLRKWKDKINLPYTLLADPETNVLNAYGAWGLKVMFGKSVQGVTRSHWVIDEEGRVIDEQIKISPEDSVKQALAVLGDS